MRKNSPGRVTTRLHLSRAWIGYGLPVFVSLLTGQTGCMLGQAFTDTPSPTESPSPTAPAAGSERGEALAPTAWDGIDGAASLRLDAAAPHSDAEEAFPLSTAMWPSNTIRVCWENPSTSNQTLRDAVRLAVADTWERFSQVRFTSWGTCGTGDEDIRIRISDEGPHTKGLGTELNGMVDGMVLNFTYNNWSTSCQSSVTWCTEVIAVHEFGHALGFAHEQNRSDTPTWCDAEQGGDGDTFVGTWDVDSVMNYCNADWNGNGELSEVDAMAARLYYDVPLGTQIGGPGSRFVLDGRGVLYGASPDSKAIYRYSASANTWTKVSSYTTRALIAGGGKVFQVASDGNIYRYSGSGTSWTKVGGPGAQFVVTQGGVLYGLSTNKSAVYKWSGSGTTWTQVGGAAAGLYAGKSTIYATSPNGSALFKYNGSGTSWTQIGTAGANWVADFEGALYGLAPDRSGVYKYTGSGTAWTQIGGPATEIYTGATTVFAKGPGDGLIYEYDDDDGFGWNNYARESRLFLEDPTLTVAIDAYNGNVYLYPRP